MTPLQAQWLTLAVVVVLTAAVVGYDLAIIVAHGPDASISRVLARLFGRWPILLAVVLFWLGVLVGHLWLPVR